MATIHGKTTLPYSRYNCLQKGILQCRNPKYNNHNYIPTKTRIYCGNKKILPSGYERMGTNQECFEKGIGVGKKKASSNDNSPSNIKVSSNDNSPFDKKINKKILFIIYIIICIFLIIILFYTKPTFILDKREKKKKKVCICKFLSSCLIICMIIFIVLFYAMDHKFNI